MIGQNVKTRAAVLAAIATVTALAGCSAGKVSQTADKVPSVEGVAGTAGDIDVRNAAIVFPESPAGYAAGSTAPLTMFVANTGEADTLVSITSPSAPTVSLAPGDPADSPADGDKTCVEITDEPSAAASGKAGGGKAGGGKAGGGKAAKPSAEAPEKAPAKPSGSATPSPGTSGSSAPEEPAGPPAANLPIPAGGLVKLSPQCPHLALSSLKTPVNSGTIVPVTLKFANAGTITLRLPVMSPTEPLKRNPVPKHEG